MRERDKSKREGESGIRPWVPSLAPGAGHPTPIPIAGGGPNHHQMWLRQQFYKIQKIKLDPEVGVELRT